MSGEVLVTKGIPLTLRLSKGERNPVLNGLLALDRQARIVPIQHTALEVGDMVEAETSEKRGRRRATHA